MSLMQTDYCAEYTLGAPPAPDAPRDLAREVKGLLVYHWIEQDGRPAVHLVSYWADRAAFDAGRGRFERALALPPPRYQGMVRRLQADGKPRWKRVVLWVWEGHWGRNALALLGFWTAIVLPVYHYLSGPLVTARFITPPDGMESGRLAGSIRISNHRSVPAKVEVSTVAARPVGTSGEVSPATFESISERIDADQVLEVPIELTLPKLPGKYQLEGSVEATSGLRRRRITVRLEPRLTQVWPDLPRAIAQPLVPDADDTRRARLTVDVLLGPPAPDGIECEVVASPPSGARLRFGALGFSYVRDVADSADAAQGSAKLSWKTRPLANPYNAREYPMDLEVIDGTIDWRAVAVTPRCAFAEEQEGQ